MGRLGRLKVKSILFAIILFELTGFLVIAANKQPFDWNAMLVGVGAVGLLLFEYGALSVFFKRFDRYVLIVVNILTGIGLITLYRISPDTALRQLCLTGGGMLCMIIAIVTVRRSKKLANGMPIYMILSILLLASSLLFGRSVWGAQNWFSIGPITFQPSEFVKILLVFTLACALSRAKRGLALFPVAMYVGICLVLLLMQKDLGAALLYAGCAIVMLYAATGRKILTLLAVALCVAGIVAAYHLFDHVKLRVALWQNPWAMYEAQGGFQIVQGLIAIASGGAFGVGLTNGMPSILPARTTDYIFAVICEEFGIFFGVAMIGLYLVLIIRGAIIAMEARNSFDGLVAMGCVTMLTIQSFIIIAGVVKLIPLTGITLPFVSYGGSSILSCYILVGILEGIAVKNADADQLEFAEQEYWEGTE